MALRTITLSLVATHPEGRPVTSAEFLAPLIRTGEPPLPRVVADRGVWASGLVTLVSEDASECAPEPSEEFERRIADGLDRAARWIAERVEALRAMTSAGLRLRIIVTGWIDQDQLDLVLPPDFLAACGAARLEITLLTND